MVFCHLNPPSLEDRDQFNNNEKGPQKNKNKINPSVVPRVYLLCEVWISFTLLLLLLLLLSQTTQKKDWKKKEGEGEGDDDDDDYDDDICVRACTVALFACEDGDSGRCRTAARSRSHHAPDRRTKLTTDSRLFFSLARTNSL